MFCSLLLEPGKRYTKVVDSPLHISAAVLDTTTQDNGIVRVMVDIGDTEALIANLSLKHGIFQFPLDLQFESGSRISFYTTGAKSNVQLSGFVICEEDLHSEDENSSDEEIPTLIQLPAKGKRKPEENLMLQNKKAKLSKPSSEKDAAVTAAAAAAVTPQVTPSKPSKKTNQIPDKKLMVTPGGDDDNDDDDDDGEEDGLDDDDSDDDDEEMEEEEEEEEEEDDEEEEEEDDDEEEEEDSDDDEEEEEEEEDVKGKKIVKEGIKQGLFPTKSSINVFKSSKKVQKSGKTPSGDAVAAQVTAATEKSKNKISSKQDSKILNRQEKAVNKQEGKTLTKEDSKTTGPKPTTLTLNGKSPKAATPAKDANKSQPGTPKSPKVVKSGGVVCEDMLQGKGPEAKNGRMVSVYYEGRLLSNKKMFDKCDTGKGFRFRLGSGEVIKGWDVGVSGMRVGGKRKITCPPHMAYGKKGAPPDIPGNATLMFVVELKGIS